MKSNNGVTQRFWMKSGDDHPQELLSWKLVQKHYFDSTFGGAIFNGQRNVSRTSRFRLPIRFRSPDLATPSPIVSDFKITPGGLFDTENLLEYDPQLRKITVIGTIAQDQAPIANFLPPLPIFRLQADPILQPLSNQVSRAYRLRQRKRVAVSNVNHRRQLRHHQ